MGSTAEKLLPKNALVIGETGVGKSSFINLVIGAETAKTSDSTGRGTFSIEEHAYEEFILWDSIGYNDVNEQSSTEAFTNLAKFWYNVKNGGINIIIYVMKKGKITAVSKKNLEFFVKTACENQVPVLLFLTHCEEQRPNEDWYLQERERFENEGMVFHAAINGTAIDLKNKLLDPDLIPIYKKKRLLAQQAAREKMRELALEKAWKPKDPLKLLKNLFKAALALGFLAGALYSLIPVLGAWLSGAELAVLITMLAKCAPK